MYNVLNAKRLTIGYVGLLKFFYYHYCLAIDDLDLFELQATACTRV